MEFSSEAAYGMTQNELENLMSKDHRDMTQQEKDIWTKEVLRGVHETMNKSK